MTLERASINAGELEPSVSILMISSISCCAAGLIFEVSNTGFGRECICSANVGLMLSGGVFNALENLIKARRFNGIFPNKYWLTAPCVFQSQA